MTQEKYTYGQMCDAIINNHDIGFYCDNIKSVLWWEENNLGKYVALYKKEYVDFTNVYNAKFIKSTKEKCLELIETYKKEKLCPKCGSDRVHYGRNLDYAQCCECGHYLFTIGFIDDFKNN